MNSSGRYSVARRALFLFPATFLKADISWVMKIRLDACEKESKLSVKHMMKSSGHAAAAVQKAVALLLLVQVIITLFLAVMETYIFQDQLSTIDHA